MNTSSLLLPILVSCSGSLWAAANGSEPERQAIELTVDYSTATIAGMSTQQVPGDDFFRFVNGGWEAATEIPAGNVRWGVRAQLREDNLKKMAALYQRAAEGGSGTSDSAKRVGDYYRAQLDYAGIEAKGMMPIKPVLAEIAALKDKSALATFLGAKLRVDVDPINFGIFETENLFGLWVAPGLQDPEHYLPYLLQGGLGLPTAETYLAVDPGQQATLVAYRNYIADLLKLAGTGAADASSKADRIIELEKRIAKTHASPEVSADLNKANTVWRRADFKTKAKGLDWDAYFAAAGLSAQQSFGAWQPEAITGISALVATTPLDVWKAYLSFHAINASARFLPKVVADKFYAFYDPLFIGPGQHRPLWDHVVSQTNTAMPGAGQLFVEQHFSARAKTKAQEIVSNIVTAFDRRIDTLAWLTPAARQHAKRKLGTMSIGVGYPDKWRSNAGLDIKPDDAFGNVQRVDAFNSRAELAKLGQPVDRKEWIFAAELFGINLMPQQNALTIPVTLLQPPLFDPNGPDAANYGSLGASIGSFIAQAFDEQGSGFDASGSANNWWSETDRVLFKKMSAALVAQYSRYQPFPDLAINGERTLKQNFADLVGLQVAYDAYHISSTTAVDKEDEKRGDQRFFIAYAMSLRQKSSEQALRGQSAGSPIAPAKFRVATVRNLDAWYPAFEVVPGQGLYLAPAARVKIW